MKDIVDPSHSHLITHQSRHTARIVAICIGAVALGMVLAHPITGFFRASAFWVLPVLVVGVLAILLIVALLVLPRLSRRA